MFFATWKPHSLLLQPLRWCCVDCVNHHERDVREEQKYMYLAPTSNNRVIPMEWSWWVTCNNACEPGEQLTVLANGDDESDLVGWSLLLLPSTVRSCAHAARDFRSQHYHVLHNMQLLKTFWDRQATLVAMKTKSRSIPMWKITWSVHYHVWSLEYSFFMHFPLWWVTRAAALGGLEQWRIYAKWRHGKV